MRTRLFLIISLVIFGVASTATVFYSEILTREFVTSVDRQLRALALTIIGPERDLRLTDLGNVDRMISKEIGAARTQKFVIIRDLTGKIIFKDKTVEELDLQSIPYNESFFTEWRDMVYMRVLTLRLPEVDNRILQVGVVMSRELTPFYISGAGRMKLILVIIVLGLISSWLLTSYLLRPLRNLGQFLASASAGVDRKTQLPYVPESLSKTVSNSDEFYGVVRDLNALIRKINDNYFMHRQWTTQMAHELKTPLSLMALRIENIFLHKKYNEADKILIDADMTKISGTINSFLDWAEVEYSENKRSLYACKVQKVIVDAVSARPTAERDRIVQETQDVTLFCHSNHLDQLIDNLLSNALKYSTPGTPIVIRLSDEQLNVVNKGPGLPPEVATRLGEPFNKGSGSEKRGHGLGLAWVKSICKINNWELNIFKNSDGETVCAVTFNKAAND